MLPQENRLRHEKDIKTLFGKQAKGVFDPVAGLKFVRRNAGVSRFAVTVGVKVSKKAVVRNRIRRQIRAMIHEHLPDLASGYDVLVLVRPLAVSKTREEIHKHLVSSLKKAKLL